MTLVKTIEDHKRNLSASYDKVRQMIEEMLSQPLFPEEQKKVYETLESYVGFHFASKLVERYPLIEKNIFKLSRNQKFDLNRSSSYRTDDGGYIAKIPIIVEVSLDKANEEKYEVSVKGKNMSLNQEREIELSCSIPEITKEARTEIAQAIKYAAEITVNAYQDEILSKILIRNLTDKGNLVTPLDAYYTLVWAPSVWDAKVIERDPAIFMKYWGENFLVYQWEIPEERSLDCLLREFKTELKNSVQIN